MYIGNAPYRNTTAGYMGNQPQYDAVINKKEYIATAGQTSFACLYDKYVEVYLNGSRLAASDYAAVDGMNVVLSAGASVNDVVVVSGYENSKYDNTVSLTGNEVVDGVKTFSSSPVVPTPTTDMQVSTKKYVDDKLAGNSTDVYIGAYGVVYVDETMPVCTRVGASGYTSIQSLMKRCVLNVDGSVRYYLDANDSTKKVDGTAAVLDGTDGNVMVEIPKVYHKYEYNSGVHTHMIALEPLDGYEVHWAFMHPTEKAYRYYPAYLGYSVGGKLISRSGVYPTVYQTIDQFRTLATANGAGWHQIDFALYELITLLMIIEYGTMDIQTALGQGRTMLTGGTWANGSLIGINGLSNKLGNGSGSYAYAGSADDAQADYSYMSYRGCENFFGNVWRFADGINATGSNAKVIYTNNNPATYASDVFTGDYTSTGVTTVSAVGYASALGNSKKGFIPTSVTGGASNKGTTDYFYTSTTVNTITLVGGYADALYAGPLNLRVVDAASLSAATVGAGVSR